MPRLRPRRYKKSLTASNLGIAIGRVKGGHTFSFSLMPPGRASLPVAVVLGPAQLTVTATLSYAGGTVTSQPITVALRP